MEIVLVVLVVLAIAAFLLLRKKAPATPPAEASSAPARARAADEPRRQPGAAAAAPAAAAKGPGAATALERDPSVARTHEAPTPDAAADASSEQELSVDDGLAEGGGEQPTEDVSGAPEPSPPPPPTRPGGAPSAARQAELASLRRGLSKSRGAEGFFGRLRSLLGGGKELDPSIAEQLEEILLTSDVGVDATEKILAQLREGLSRGDLADEAKVLRALREQAYKTVAVEGTAGALLVGQRPTVVLFVGVNGAGKTTTIGKLAQKLRAEGKHVMLAAADTFRAAAVDQLKAWGDRAGCEVITGKENADPSSVLFDAVRAATAAGADVLLADTAGRLHTKANLMQEMAKIEKTVAKAMPGAPHEVFLVIDATNGQNALAQAREFKETLRLTGLVLTKLDGTARGGVVLGICDSLRVPVRYVGVGEKAEDLHEFDPAAFVEALLGIESDEIPS